MRGYFGIGVEGIGKAMNVGSLLPTAHAFGASFMFTQQQQWCPPNAFFCPPTAWCPPVRRCGDSEEPPRHPVQPAHRPSPGRWREVTWRR